MSIVIVAAFPSFFGKGQSFPLRLDLTNSRPQLSQDEQRVKESIDQILNTDIVERPFAKKNGYPFGTRIRRQVFSDLDAAVDVIKYETKRALDLWEPRIVVDSVGAIAQQFPTGWGVVADVAYHYRATSRDDNAVVPFILRRNT